MCDIRDDIESWIRNPELLQEVEKAANVWVWLCISDNKQEKKYTMNFFNYTDKKSRWNSNKYFKKHMISDCNFDEDTNI